MTTYVALLRGINVGGKHSLPMKELTGLFTDAGCAGVRTYVQSGNVVFEASAALAKRIPQAIAKEIARAYGYEVPVVLRTVKELGEVIAANPFLAESAEPRSLHMAFLAEAPTAAARAALDPKRSPGDRFVVRGKDVYLHLPNGVGKSKLNNAYLDSTLKTVSTIRNWNTVRALVELGGLRG